MDFKEHIIEKIVDITGLEREVVEKSVEVPPDEKMGDIAFPCFPLAKVMRKAPPIIAQELAEKMSGDDMIEKAQAAGGYLNFFLNREKFISETVSSALDAGEDWGKSDMGKGKTVLSNIRHRISQNRSISVIFSQRLSEIHFQRFTSTLDMTFSRLITLATGVRSSVSLYVLTRDGELKRLSKKTL